ncbi:MAG TPA: hypothetical protein VHE99_06085 [Gammaproteobacteria bacterium]|nr:hypothetical protein [Gammaproteobacteria bacterium]
MSLAFKGKLEVQTWDQVREDVAKVNPEFARIIDEINPDKKHWLARASYPYGSLILQRALFMLPNQQGDIVAITDSSIDPKLRAGLDYNLNSNPVCMILQNSCELFLPLESHTVSFHGLIYSGEPFGAWRVLNPEKTQQPVFIWDMSAGARSIFMLPKISEDKKHIKLRKRFDLTVSTPKSLMAHWEIFRQIANHPTFEHPWQCEVLFFSKNWFEHLEDVSWKNFYYYFHDSIWRGTEFFRNQVLWNLIFSIILKEYEAKSSGYIIDTVKYLMFAGIGEVPGFGPAKDNSAGPILGLQNVYIKDYEIRNYPPIIMHPQVFNMYNLESSPIYYSLQFPIAPEFMPHSRTRSSFVSDLHEIRSLIQRHLQEFLSGKYNIDDTPFYDLFNLVSFDYFHNNVDLHAGMRNSSEMPLEDKNLLTTVDGVLHKNFPDMCSFVKGCIRISHKTFTKKV